MDFVIFTTSLIEGGVNMKDFIKEIDELFKKLFGEDVKIIHF